MIKAEAGKFEDAVITQEKVIESLKKDGMPQNLMTPYIERLNSYKALTHGGKCKSCKYNGKK